MHVESFFNIALHIEAIWLSTSQKLSQKALDMYSVLLLRISKREMNKLAIVQGEIFG